MRSLGKIADATPGASAPSTVGPSTMPASTSPITRGCPIATDAMPNSRATSITTATATKNAAKRLPASRCLRAVSVSASSPSPTMRVIVRSAARPSIAVRSPSSQATSPLSAPLSS